MLKTEFETQKLNIYETTLLKLTGSKVLIRMKNGEFYSGILSSIDGHMNIVLSEAADVEDNGSTTVDYGILNIRGDSVFFINPDDMTVI
ncbi:MAG: LSM domain-containing protein [Promethearchaeota archaeon]